MKTYLTTTKAPAESRGWGPPGLTLAICMNSVGHLPLWVIWKMGIRTVTPREATVQIKQDDKVTHTVGAE